MAVNVCVCEENLEVDETGRLCVKHDCSLVDGAGGLAMATISENVFDGATESPDAAIILAGVNVGPTQDLEIINPSSCRSMLLHVIEESYLEVEIGTGDVCRLQHQRSDNGAALEQSNIWRTPSIATTRTEGHRHNMNFFRTIAPGATYTWFFQIRATLLSGAGASFVRSSTLNLYLDGRLI